MVVELGPDPVSPPIAAVAGGYRSAQSQLSLISDSRQGPSFNLASS